MSDLTKLAIWREERNIDARRSAYDSDMRIRRLFSEHPASVGETYGEHFHVAGHFAFELAKASALCAVHAVFPALYTRTASTKVIALCDEMTSGARARPVTVAPAA